MEQLTTKEQETEIESTLKEAGQLLMDYWPGNSRKTRQIEIFTKSDDSPVTSADLASNEIIVNRLRELFPGDAILSEEIPESHGKTPGGRLWVLDPLDGTRIFISGRPQFGILLGLCIDGHAQAGYIYVPSRDLYLTGSMGRQGCSNHKPLSVSESKTVRPGGLYCKRRGSLDPGIFTTAAGDAAEAFLLVCEGKIDALVAHRAKCSDWDLAAPAAVVHSCGGVLSDETGKELRFGCGAPKAEYVIISNRHVHQEVLRLLPELRVQS